jgi:hypothetical protein
MDVSEAKRLKQFLEENAKLKKVFGRADVECSLAPQILSRAAKVV